uniref:LITAF domain-containing protein n=2 Tax=Bursaphelenchus xylophilus TaxID=6326 RepID=A0A1I7RL10_BURXY
MSGSPPPPYSDVPPAPIKVPPPSDPSFPPSPQFGYAGGAPPPPPSAPNASPPQIPVPLAGVNVNTGAFGPFPVEMDCRYCHNHIVTHTRRVAGTLPWIIMGICFVLGFFLIIPWCICCVPFCVDACLDVLHTCPSCKRTVGRFTRL